MGEISRRGDQVRETSYFQEIKRGPSNIKTETESLEISRYNRGGETIEIVDH